MAERTRSTLKKFFEDGSLPSEEHFHDLIDSMLNMGDEGFRKTPPTGLQVSSQGSHDSLISFSRDSQPTRILWQISFDQAHGHDLMFWDRSSSRLLDEPSATGEGDGSAAEAAAQESGDEPQPVLTLGGLRRVGVNTVKPEHTLDVNGTIRSHCRLGTVPKRAVRDDDKSSGAGSATDAATEPRPVVANGKWQTITTALDGCHALEIVAGAGKKDTGRYALLHAVALNTFNPRGFFFNFLRRKNRIRCRQAWYRSRSDKLSLRWVGDKHAYYLQIRSNGDYGLDANGDPIRIIYHITEMWADPLMSESWATVSR